MIVSLDVTGQDLGVGTMWLPLNTWDYGYSHPIGSVGSNLSLDGWEPGGGEPRYAVGMGEPARKLVTYADVLDAPDGMNAEILDGELYLSPRPAPDHASAALAIASDLRERFGRRRGGPGPGGWWILIEPELHLGGADPTTIVAVPDLAAWRRERMPEIPRAPAITLPPDWICEILSPGARNTRRDRVLKPDLYATRGVSHLWIADPVERLLEVWELRDGVYARIQAFSGDCIVSAKPFDAVELDLSEWWLPEP